MGNDRGRERAGRPACPGEAGPGFGSFQRCWEPRGPSPFLPRRRLGAKRQLSHWTRTSPRHSPTWKSLKGAAQGLSEKHLKNS